MTENRRSSAPRLALAVLALGLFMTLLDLTIVNVAIPSMVDDLHASLDQTLWVLNGYSLAYAVLLITSGRLGDVCGPRNMLGAGAPGCIGPASRWRQLACSASFSGWSKVSATTGEPCGRGSRSRRSWRPVWPCWLSFFSCSGGVRIAKRCSLSPSSRTAITPS